MGSVLPLQKKKKMQKTGESQTFSRVNINTTRTFEKKSCLYVREEHFFKSKPEDFNDSTYTVDARVTYIAKQTKYLH